MSDEVVLRERVAVTAPVGGFIEIVTVNRPKAMNALNSAMMDGLLEAFTDIALDDEVRAVVLTGAGKAFVAGADIVAMSDFDAMAAEAFAAHGQALGDVMEKLPVPIVAAVGGYALGGGCELAMCCDIVIAGQRAVFGQPEVKLGVIPGFGGTQRLTRRVGIAKAMDLCLTGRMVKADEALSMGIASRVAEGDTLEAAVEIAQTIASMGPVAVRLCKRAIHENADASLATGLKAERTLFALCFATDDQTEGMAAFAQKRAAQFTGR